MSKLAHSNERTMMSLDLIAAREALGSREAWALFMEALDDYERPLKLAAQQKARREYRNRRIAEVGSIFVLGFAAGFICGLAGAPQ